MEGAVGIPAMPWLPIADVVFRTFFSEPKREMYDHFPFDSFFEFMFTKAIQAKDHFKT